MQLRTRKPRQIRKEATVATIPMCRGSPGPLPRGLSHLWLVCENFYAAMNDIDKSANLPNHVAIIMDGNGRWAKERFLPRKAGHKKGVDAIKKAVYTAEEYGIKYITFYAFSTENWKRPKDEINSLFSLIEEFVNKFDKEFKGKEYRINIMGDLSKLPDDLVLSLNSICKRTKAFDKLIINIGINYGGRDEIVHAVNKLIENNKTNISEKDIKDNLYINYLPDPDIILRTAGEKRLSNFLLWQCAYSELIFIDEYWPEFDKDLFDRVLDEYYLRNRRFGGLNA